MAGDNKELLRNIILGSASYGEAVRALSAVSGRSKMEVMGTLTPDAYRSFRGKYSQPSTPARKTPLVIDLSGLTGGFTEPPHSAPTPAARQHNSDPENYYLKWLEAELDRTPARARASVLEREYGRLELMRTKAPPEENQILVGRQRAIQGLLERGLYYDSEPAEGRARHHDDGKRVVVIGGSWKPAVYALIGGGIGTAGGYIGGLAIFYAAVQSAIQNGDFSSIQNAAFAQPVCSFFGFIGGAFIGYHQGQFSYENDLRRAGLEPEVYPQSPSPQQVPRGATFSSASPAAPTFMEQVWDTIFVKEEPRTEVVEPSRPPNPADYSGTVWGRLKTDASGKNTIFYEDKNHYGDVGVPTARAEILIIALERGEDSASFAMRSGETYPTEWAKPLAAEDIFEKALLGKPATFRKGRKMAKEGWWLDRVVKI